MTTRLGLVFAAAAWLAASAAFAEDELLGQRVFIKPDAQPLLDGQPVGIETLPFPAVVGQVKDDRLWLEHAWVRRSEVMTAQQAFDFFSGEIRKNPASAVGWRGRGAVRNALGQFDEAATDLTEAIRLDPPFAAAYNYRSEAWLGLGDEERALADLTEALRLNPRLAAGRVNFANVRSARGDYAGAIEALQDAVKMEPKLVEAHNNLAWLYATCPDERFRDGAKAVQSALVAHRLTGGRNIGCLDTLAAAYAEQGDFKSAVEYQGQCVWFAPPDVRNEIQQRLDLYKGGQPYRMPAPER